MKRSTQLIACFLFTALCSVWIFVAPVAARTINLYEQRVADLAAPEYYERLLGLTPSVAAAGHIFRESARVSAIAKGFPSADTIADPMYYGRYICHDEGFVFVQQCLWEQGFSRKIVSHEPGVFDLSDGIYFGRAQNAQADEVLFVFDSARSQLFLALTLAKAEKQPLSLPSSVIGEWPELPDGAMLVRAEYAYAPSGSYVDLFVKGLTETSAEDYQEQIRLFNPQVSVLTDETGLLVDPSTGSHVFAVPLADNLYLDEQGDPIDVESLLDSIYTVEFDSAPAEEPPTVDWTSGSFALKLYDEWTFDEEISGDTYFNFIPQGDYRQGLLVENIPIPLNDFSEDFQGYVDMWLTGEWATSSELVFVGDAYLEEFPDALVQIYDIYYESEQIAQMFFVAVQGNHADTFVLTYWEELEHEGVPSYYEQAMRIIESFTLQN